MTSIKESKKVIFNGDAQLAEERNGAAYCRNADRCHPTTRHSENFDYLFAKYKISGRELQSRALKAERYIQKMKSKPT